MAILYFAKLNINSQIFEVYDKGEEYLNELLKEIYNEMIETNYVLEKEVIAIDPDVICDSECDLQNFQKRTSYELKVIYNEYPILKANFMKKSPIMTKQKDHKDNLIPNLVENYESIELFIDFENEIIGFFTAQRFGYRQFEEHFEEYINNMMHNKYESFNKSVKKYVKIRLITYNTSFDDFYKLLLKEKNINTIKVSIIPPNASESFIRNMDEKAKGKIEKMKDAFITEKTIEWNSSAPTGINIDSEEIRNIFEEAEEINKSVNTKKKEKTKNNEDDIDRINYQYVNAEATNMFGEKFTTEDNTLYKYEVKEKHKNMGLHANIEQFKMVVKRIVDNIIT